MAEGSTVLTPGQHVGWEVDGATARAILVTSWAREGLGRGERVVYIEPRWRSGWFRHWLEDDGVDWERARGSGQISVLTPQEHLSGDGFDPQRRVSEHARFVERSAADGYSAVRFAAEPADALGVILDHDSWREYEAALDQLCRTHPLSVLCLHDGGVPEPDLASFAHAHPRAVADQRMRAWAERGSMRLTGEVDLSNVELLAGLLAAPRRGEVVVDMAGLSFIDVGTTAELVQLARRLRPHGAVRLCAPPPQVRTILTAVGREQDVELITEAQAP